MVAGSRPKGSNQAQRGVLIKLFHKFMGNRQLMQAQQQQPNPDDWLWADLERLCCCDGGLTRRYLGRNLGSKIVVGTAEVIQRLIETPDLR